MLKKTIVTSLISMAAIICLPFGYGIWNECIGISANITFAEPTVTISASIYPDSGETSEPGVECVIEECVPPTADAALESVAPNEDIPIEDAPVYDAAEEEESFIEPEQYSDEDLLIEELGQ